MSMRLVVLSRLTQLEEWVDPYKSLLTIGTSPRCRLFLSPEWLITWWRHCGGGQPLCLLVVEAQRLVAAAPLYVRSDPALWGAKVVRLIGSGPSDYGDFLMDPEKNGALSLIWQWLSEHRHLWDLILLDELPDDSNVVRSLPTLAAFPQWSYRLCEGEKCRWVPLGPNGTEPSASSWRQRITPSLSKQLARRQRQLTRLFRVRHDMIGATEDVPCAMRVLFALHRLRWAQRKQTGVFVSPRLRSFLTEFCQKAVTAGWLRLHLLYLNEVAAAVYLAFHDRDWSGFYTCGFHPAFARYSIGKVLLAFVLDQAEQEGASLFDFMRGDETYKGEFNAQVSRNYRLEIWQKGRSFSEAAAKMSHLLWHIRTKGKVYFQR
ncbi:MAG: GNAT family N-acetyltransferase [Armatimonadetes bacterium]|nr:GNAT family N-acetyltransferase [Armatimonadota bacterium]MDW8120931.1 GNAT family N-acetyltransferase [Armatimonadota bacterium]